MFAFNALPSSRKTPEIKALRNKKDFSLAQVPIASIVNYINFDPRIADRVNDIADGTVSEDCGRGGATQTTEADAEGIQSKTS